VLYVFVELNEDELVVDAPDEAFMELFLLNKKFIEFKL